MPANVEKAALFYCSWLPLLKLGVCCIPECKRSGAVLEHYAGTPLSSHLAAIVKASFACLAQGQDVTMCRVIDIFYAL